LSRSGLGCGAWISFCQFYFAFATAFLASVFPAAVALPAVFLAVVILATAAAAIADSLHCSSQKKPW
jgi:hypothetical protein